MIIVITGPTSTGKTALALELAKKLNTELINSDSRQTYKYLDIGTNKLPLDYNHSIQQYHGYWLVDDIRINLYDIATPDQDYNVSHFSGDSEAIIKRLLKENKIPIVIGGTGFYLNALFNPMHNQRVPKNNVLREELESLTVEELRKRLPKQELEFMNESDINNSRRLTRKIEIIEFSKNNKMINQVKQNKFKDVLYIGLTDSRENLYKNVDQWVNSIWSELINEINYLDELGYADTTPMKGIIYKTAFKFVKSNGALNDQEAIERIQFDLHKYIRKQQTYLNKMQEIKWFRNDEVDQKVVVESIMEKVNKNT